MTTDAGFTPILLGADTLGYSYAREFHKHYGLNTVMMSCFDIKYSTASKFTDFTLVEDFDKEDVTMEWLRNNAQRFANTTPLVLGAASDWHVRTLSKHKDELQDLGYVIPYIDFDLLDEVTQKDRFYAACDAEGVPYPKTWVVPFGESYDPSFLEGTQMRLVDARDALASLEYPLIAKPSNSADWHYADIEDKHKVYTIKDADHMLRVYDQVAASSYHHALLLQEVLNTSDESLHSLTTFSDAQGNMLVGVSGNVLVQDRSATGIGNPLVILGDERRQDLLQDAAKLLKHFEYEGYANFDVMNDADGNPHFLEVNTRPGRNTFYVSLAGCPFVKPIVEHYVHGRDLHEALDPSELAAEDPFLFCMVPRSVVEQETHGDKKERALKLFDAGVWQNPLLNKEDGAKQRFWAKVNFEHMRSKF